MDDCHPATSLPNTLSALGLSLVPRTVTLALAHPTASTQMMSMGSALSSDWPTRLGHSTQPCGRVKAPALGQALSKAVLRKSEDRAEGRRIYQAPEDRGLREGLSPASLSLVAHIPCAHIQVSLERHQEWDY